MKILLIADDLTIAETLNMLLKPHRASILTTCSELEGIDLARKTSPDLIILDRSTLAQKDWQICRIVRSVSPAPILITSVQDDPIQIANALDAGADHYLTKPISECLLLAYIKNLIRRSRQSQGWTKTIWMDQISAF